MTELFEQLPTVLAGPLPGDKAHQLLRVKGGRSSNEPKQTGTSAPLRESAVLCLLSPDLAGDWQITLVKRVSYEGWHSAQIAFPGGKPEPEDGSLEATAQRETWEEVGLTADAYTIVGRLTPVDVSASGFRIYPFVALSQKLHRYIPEPREVDQVVHFPLAELTRESALTEGLIHLDYPKGLTLHGPYFPLEDESGEHQVWGATAMVLSELRWLLRA